MLRSDSDVFGQILKYSSVVLGFLVVVYSIVVFAHAINQEWGPGWDFSTTCEAAYAYLHKKDPFKPESYDYNKNFYTYSTFSLRLYWRTCRLMGIKDVQKVYAYFPWYWLVLILTAYLAAVIGRYKQSFFETFFVLIAAFAGVSWVIKTGNVTFLEMIFLMLALSFLCRVINSTKRGELIAGYAFAICLGAFCAVKSIYVAFTPLLFLLPGLRKHVVSWMLIVLVIGLLPEVLSYIQSPELVREQITNIRNDQKLCNPSVICLLSDRDLTYKIVISDALVIISGCTLLYFAWRSASTVEQAVRLRDTVLNSDNPVLNVKLFILSLMIVLAVLPRLKEYTFCLEAVLLMYYLIVRRKFDGFYVAVTLVSILPLVFSDPTHPDVHPLGYYSQLVVLWIVLAMFSVDMSKDLQRTVQRPLS